MWRSVFRGPLARASTFIPIRPMSGVLAESGLFAGSPLRVLAGGVFSALLVAACITDVRQRRIPNLLVVVLAVAGLAYSVSLEPWLAGLGRAVGGFALGFSIWIMFYVAGAIGAGDVKLFAAAGAWLGPGGAWRAALVAAAVGGIVAVAALARQRRVREGFEKVMIAVSSRSADGLAVDPSAPRSRHLPYGVALACGALIVAWIPGVLR